MKLSCLDSIPGTYCNDARERRYGPQVESARTPTIVRVPYPCRDREAIAFSCLAFRRFARSWPVGTIVFLKPARRFPQNRGVRPLLPVDIQQDCKKGPGRSSVDSLLAPSSLHVRQPGFVFSIRFGVLAVQ